MIPYPYSLISKVGQLRLFWGSLDPKHKPYCFDLIFSNLQQFCTLNSSGTYMYLAHKSTLCVLASAMTSCQVAPAPRPARTGASLPFSSAHALIAACT